MFLFFGTLKNTWLFVNVRIRKNFLHYYNLDTNMAKQPRIICCCDPLFELCLSALWANSYEVNAFHVYVRVKTFVRRRFHKGLLVR